MKNIKNTLLLIFICTTFCHAQIDNEFWFVAPEVGQGHGDRPIFLKFATYGESSNIMVTQPANSSFDPIEFQMEPNDSYVLDLTNLIDIIENKPSHTILNYGLKITSTNDIMVYYEVSPSCNCNPDIFSLKGKNSLGKYFITPFQSFNNSSNGFFAGFNIVATENNTNIDIKLTQDSEQFLAGEEFSINLNKGETYFVKVSNNINDESLSGSIISSDKNIAVTIHEDTISGPYGGCADLVGDQLIPVDLLGQEYIAVKGYLYGDDKVYVTAQNNNTEVLVDGILYSVLNAFETIEISLSDNSVYITTSEPSYVLHMSGFGCEVGQAILPPLDCTGSFDVSVVRSTNEFFALNILVPNGSEDDFYVEGSGISINQEDFDFVPGSNQNWKFAQLDLTSQIGVNTAIRVINSTDRFHMGLIHGGAGSGCRYGYFSDYGEFDSSFSVETNICEGQTIEFQAPEFQSANYSWTGPNGFSSDQQNPIIENVNISSQGEYFLEISIDDVCTSSSSLFVEINPQPLDFELFEISICEYRFVSDLLVDFPNINIYASANDTTPLALNSRLDVGTYYISQTNEFNCSSENLVDVYLSCFPNIPNAFSPNNDSLNDYFNIQNLYDIYINHELQIFNRYGNVIFEGNNENKWYGYNEITNSKVPVGTYFYILSLNNEEKDVLSGWVYVNY